MVTDDEPFDLYPLTNNMSVNGLALARYASSVGTETEEQYWLLRERREQRERNDIKEGGVK